MLHPFLTCFLFNAQVLVTLHQAVIPFLSNPIMLWWMYKPTIFFFPLLRYDIFFYYILSLYLITCSDFLTRSYDIGGVVSVMALSSLFILMTQHGLEYPNFYEKLYALLVPSIFMAKHRAKFFEVMQTAKLFTVGLIWSWNYILIEDCLISLKVKWSQNLNMIL